MYSTKFITLLALVLGLITGLQAQQVEEKLLLKVSASPVITSTHFGYYDLNLPNEIPKPFPVRFQDYRLSLAYPISKKISLGASLLSFNRIRFISYQEPELIGRTAANPYTNEIMTYAQTEYQEDINDKYLSAFVEADLIQIQGFYLRARLGFAYALVRNSSFQFNFYRSPQDFNIIEDGFFPETALTQKANVPGIEGGVKLGYNFAPNIGLSFGANYMHTAKVPLTNQHIRYANLELGLDVQIAQPEENTCNNTILLGLGWPLSLSYERLIAVRKHHHSIRLFYDQYWYFLGTPGLAYNLKIGEENSFFIIEPGFFLNSEPLAGVQLGYEYRSEKGFVARLDGGAMFNEVNFRMRFQGHIGYAF
ncbi:MAG: hypothetical protein AAF927_17785 [Bacteroidota bacterium]